MVAYIEPKTNITKLQIYSEYQRFTDFTDMMWISQAFSDRIPQVSPSKIKTLLSLKILGRSSGSTPSAATSKILNLL